MNQDYINALLGGGIIGLVAALMMHINGRVAGVSGIVSGIFKYNLGDWAWRLFFVMGLIVGGVLMYRLRPEGFMDTTALTSPRIVLAGLLVGFGALLGGGCTSGHGVCGISRLSLRSIAATLTFIAAGIVTVLVNRFLLA